MAGVTNTGLTNSRDKFAPVPQGNKIGPTGKPVDGPGIKGAPTPKPVGGAAPNTKSRFKKRKG